MTILWFAQKASVIVSNAVSSIATDEDLDGQQNIANANEGSDVTINKSTLGGANDCLVVGQSFNAIAPFVEKITIKCKKTGTPSAGMYIEIYEGDGSDVPTGSVIATSATVAVTDISTDATEEEFTFTEKNFTQPLIPGKQYVFVVETDATQSDAAYYTVRFKGTASTYSGGKMSRSDDDSSFTASDTEDLYFYIYSGDVASYCKDVRVRGGERDVDAQKLLGYNEVMDEKRASCIEVTFTAVYSTKMVQAWISGDAQSVTGNYYRNIGGEKSSNDRSKKSVLIRLTDGTNHINVMLNDAYCTVGERSLAADGHMEENFTLKGLSSNYYEEDDYA